MRSTHVLGLLFAVASAATLAVACGGDDSSPATGGGDDGGPQGDDATTQPSVDGSNGGDSAPTPAPFGLDSRPSNTTCIAPARPPSTAPVAFTRVFGGVTLAAPLMMRQLPADPSRFFVSQRSGTIVSFPATNPPATPTTVYTTPITPQQAGEGGLLGFAFHPSFAQNGLMFFSYTPTDATVTGSNMRSVIARVHSTDGGKTFGEYTEIVAFPQTTATNHKGGGIQFGPDGYLYFSFGDGGGGNDQFAHGQNPNLYFAKIHRIDVDTPPPAGKTYVVPADNPFANGGGQDSTYVWGLRNPFRFGFDSVSHDLWIGDVGQNQWEEVDRVQAPGANAGWPCYEATHPYEIGQPVNCPNPKANFLSPVWEYGHTNGASKAIIGGVVYRGKNVPAMVGTYLFADEVSGEIWALEYDSQGQPNAVQLNTAGPNGNWVDFAEDDAGELYVIDIAGKIYELSPVNDGGDAGSPPDAGNDPSPPLSTTLSGTGCVDPNDATKPAPGLIPYTVNSPLWSDGATKDRYIAIPDGATIGVGADGHLDLPIGSVLMKTFSLGGVRIETRLLVRHHDGGWAGYTYEWNDAGTDATLLPSSKTKSVGAQSWFYPSRSDCFNCHSSAANRTLGMLLAQLNGDELYPSTNRISNQLATLDHIGMFTAPLATPPAQIEAFPTPTGSSGTLEQRARSYLQANCSICHRPNGNGGGPMNLLYDTPLGNATLCGVTPSDGTLGVDGGLLLAPGDPARSMISIRPHALDSSRMPPLASHVVDTNGLAVIDSWIQSLTSCPAAVDAGAGDAADQ